MTARRWATICLKFRKRPALLSWWFNRLARHARRESLEPAPILDALLPILEYSYERLQAGGFSDALLTAAIKADARIARAAEQLEPLGIYREDLCLLLQERMKERLKMRRRKAGLSGKRRKPQPPPSLTPPGHRRAAGRPFSRCVARCAT